MPKRSNEFQELIFQLERALTPENARVIESKMIYDPVSEINREIDIAIEVNIGGHNLLIAIECIDHSRLADVTWIEKIVGKYENIKVNKLVTVSRKGFWKSAERKAKWYYIDTFILMDVEKTEWSHVLDSILTITCHSIMKPYVSGITIVFDELARETIKKTSPDEVENLPFYDPDGRFIGTASEVCQNYCKLFEGEEVKIKVEEFSYKDKDDSLQITLEVPIKKGLYTIYNDGQKHLIKSVFNQRQI